MGVIIPGIVQIDECSGLIISIAEHSVACNLDEYRPSGIYFLHVLFKSKTNCISVITIDILGIILNNPVAAGFIEIAQTMASVYLPGFTTCVIVKRSSIRIAIKCSSSIRTG